MIREFALSFNYPSASPYATPRSSVAGSRSRAPGAIRDAWLGSVLMETTGIVGREAGGADTRRSGAAHH